MTELFQSLITILVFIVMLGGLVLIHELGHFITARWAKVRVLEFGIGFPPRARILGRGKRPAYDAGRPPRPDPALPPGVEPGSDEALSFLAVARALDEEAGSTLYTLNWLPIGGFVKLEGEDGGDDADPHSFANAKLWVKVGILLAGVTMNLLLSFVIFTGIALWWRARASASVIEEVVPGVARGRGRPRRRRRDRLGERQTCTRSSTCGTATRSSMSAPSPARPVTIGILHADGTIEDVTVTLRVPTRGASRARSAIAAPGRRPRRPSRTRRRGGRRRSASSGPSTRSA